VLVIVKHWRVCIYCTLLHRTDWRCDQEGSERGTMSRASNHWGRRNVPTMSQVLSSIQ